MTNEQKDAIAKRRQDQVGWPPMFEADNGCVDAIFMESFSSPQGAPFPRQVSVCATRFYPDGTFEDLADGSYVLQSVTRATK